MKWCEGSGLKLPQDRGGSSQSLGNKRIPAQCLPESLSTTCHHRALSSCCSPNPPPLWPSRWMVLYLPVYTTPSSEADTSCAPHSHGDQNPAWVHFCADTTMAAPGTAHEQGASLCLRGATHASWSPGPKKRLTSSGPTSLDFEAECRRGGNVPGINGLGCCGQRCHRDRTRGQEVSCDSPGTVDRQKSHLWPGSRVSQNEAGRAGAGPFQTEKPGPKAEARG